MFPKIEKIPESPQYEPANVGSHLRVHKSQLNICRSSAELPSQKFLKTNVLASS